MICQCLTAPTVDGWLREIRAEREFASMYEFRMDRLGSLVPDDGTVADRDAALPVVNDLRDRVLPELAGRPWILTIRRGDDLGSWPVAAESERCALFVAALELLKPTYVDLEYWFGDGEVHDAAGRVGATVVRSRHMVDAFPEDPAVELAMLAERPGEIAKLAVTPTSATETLELLRASAVTNHQVCGLEVAESTQIVIGMGEFGLITRVAPHLFASRWTYSTSPVGGRTAAPGQYPPRVLSETYRVGVARRSWPLFAVLGSPIAHSRSPEYHNRRFIEEGVEALYVPIRADSFPEFEALATELDLQGVSVTVPHKESALAAAAETSASARLVGAANTLVRREGRTVTAVDAPPAAAVAPTRAPEPPGAAGGDDTGGAVPALEAEGPPGAAAGSSDAGAGSSAAADGGPSAAAGVTAGAPGPTGTAGPAIAGAGTFTDHAGYPAPGTNRSDAPGRSGLPRWYADNTDVDGFLSALDDRPLRSALVVGAGGASRAIVTGLLQRGAAVWIANRTRERALTLAEHFGIPANRVLPLDGPFPDASFDIVVQTTSVGMEPDIDGDPIAAYTFTGAELVYDIIYTPAETRLLARARGAGCATINGSTMFDDQAEAQFVQYLGRVGARRSTGPG